MSLRFENLRGQDCQEAIKALRANAQVLFDTADDVALKGNYGLARSMLILGSEEFIKGSILYLNSIGIKVFSISDVRRAINSHKERHGVAIVIKLFKLLDTFIQLEEHQPPVFSSFNWLNKLASFASHAKIFIDGLAEIGSDATWWIEANNFKNAGLYVDYRDGLVLPVNVTDADYTMARSKVRDLVERITLFQFVFERVTQKEKKQMVESLNKGVKLLIKISDKGNLSEGKNLQSNSISK